VIVSSQKNKFYRLLSIVIGYILWNPKIRGEKACFGGSKPKKQ
jgi:hypothetical protein